MVRLPEPHPSDIVQHHHINDFRWVVFQVRSHFRRGEIIPDPTSFCLLHTELYAHRRAQHLTFMTRWLTKIGGIIKDGLPDNPITWTDFMGTAICRAP
jgi:hypothetical protein